MDKADFRILRALQDDGRVANRALADEVSLAPSTCLERVRQLREAGVVRGVHADIDPAALGVGLEAFYFVGLTRHSRDVVEAFQDEISGLPEVRSIFLVSGQYDFLIHVAVRDTGHLRDLALDALTVRPEVTRIETVLVFDQQRNYQLPNYIEEDC